MKFEKRMFRSKLARRVFAMFFVCALMPISGLSLLSLIQVSKQLEAQSYRRLEQLAKTYSLSIYERLIFLSRDMHILASTYLQASKTDMPKIPSPNHEALTYPFKGLAIFDETGGHKTMLGDITQFPVLTRAAGEHLRNKKTAIATLSKPDTGTSVFMAVAMAPKQSPKIFFAQIKNSYLFGKRHETILPYGTDVAVLDSSGNFVFSTLEQDILQSIDAGLSLNRSAAGLFEIEHRGEIFSVSLRQLFLKSRFFETDWKVMLLQSKSDALLPLSSFKATFPLVAALALLVVIILSLYSIRKSLTPLDILKEGTKRLSTEDFGYRVKIDSRDEFEGLADAFNDMSSRLEKQFNAINARADVDRAILSSLDTTKIVKTVMKHMQSYYQFDRVLVSMLDPEYHKTTHSFILKRGLREPIQVINIHHTQNDLEKLYANPDHMLIRPDEEKPAFLSTIDTPKESALLLLPILVARRLAAVITIFGSETAEHTQKEIIQARQTADQVALALTNASILEALKEMNWGAMKALARTVDAKSPWTAGHSERVAEIALNIGEVLCLNADELDDLYRAGLLHDIGKIGIDSAILDKSGRLSDAEHTIIREHPAIGANILRPIKAFKMVIPMVFEHHERYDGNGYPTGVSGRKITSGARILALADTFDAMSYSRPYRKGIPLDRVIGIITEESGRMFDPEIVDAFLTVKKQKKLHAA